MMYKNRTKVIRYLIDNHTRYKWRFDINTKIFESLNIKDCVKNVLKWIESLVNPLFCYIFALEVKTWCRDKDK